VESPSLEIFKTRLDKVLCSLLWVTLLGQGVGLGDPQRSLPTPTILCFCDLQPMSTGCKGKRRTGVCVWVGARLPAHSLGALYPGGMWWHDLLPGYRRVKCFVPCMASSCIREGLVWIVGKISVLKEWSDIGPGCSGQRWSPHPCVKLSRTVTVLQLWLRGLSRGLQREEKSLCASATDNRSLQTSQTEVF